MRGPQGEALTKDALSGALTKLAAYRGTSCSVDVADYAVRRINAQKTPGIERALRAMKKMKSSVRQMMKLLTPRDFETLVDLVFSTSGWRRLGVVGKTQKTLDLDLLLPSTGERAFVQVKSQTTSAELADYVGKLDELGHTTECFMSITPERHKPPTRVSSSLHPEDSPNLCWTLASSPG